jgi:hypothetical protein
VVAGSNQDDDEVLATDEVTGPSVPKDRELCPVCGAPRIGTDRFCEADGYDFASGSVPERQTGSVPERQTVWEAVVTADREYFDAIAPEGIQFPADHASRTFALEADEVVVGRRSVSRGIEPQIDLSNEPVDDGISHCHAVLVRGEGGAYSLVDRGSTNGTSVNGTDPVPLHTPVPLGDGDRIHLGGWTTITIRVVTR